MLPCWFLLHQQCLASIPLPGFLCIPLLCVQPCLGALDLMLLGLATGKAAASPVGHRQLPNLALHSPRGWSWTMLELLSLWTRGAGGTPMSRHRQPEPIGAGRAPQLVGGRLPRQGVQALTLDCAPRSRSRAVCK